MAFVGGKWWSSTLPLPPERSETKKYYIRVQFVFSCILARTCNHWCKTVQPNSTYFCWLSSHPSSELAVLWFAFLNDGFLSVGHVYGMGYRQFNCVVFVAYFVDDVQGGPGETWI